MTSLISFVKNIFFSYKVNKPRLLIPELEADLLDYFPKCEVEREEPLVLSACWSSNLATPWEHLLVE